MFDHVTIRVSDVAAAGRFYDAALGARTNDGEHFVEWGDFGIAPVSAGHPLTRGLHVVFATAGPAGHLRDPDGNRVELVHDDAGRAGLSRLVLHTRDVPAAKRFFVTIAPVVGIRLVHDLPGEVAFGDGDGSFSFAAGDEPTEHVHLAFGAPDRATVDEFHRAATVAGYADNGPPGPRPEYHAGYYGAFVLAPDGHNVEAVHHHR